MTRVITVLSRRSRWFKNGENDRLNLSHTDLRGADLSNAHFEWAIITEANFEGAILKGTHFENAILYNSNFERVLFIMTHFKGSILMGAKGLTRSQIDCCIIDTNTMLPGYLQEAQLEEETDLDFK